MSLNYAIEKIGLAVRTLATGESKLRERLIDATASSLIHVPEEMLPDGIGRRFRELKGALTAVNGPGGSVRYTISGLSDARVKELAGELADLETALLFELLDQLQTVKA